MREIKFRAWDKEKKRMVDVDGINFNEFGFQSFKTASIAVSQCYSAGILYEKIRLSEVDLMQFTGLLDKNGKEIYEGDILRLKVKYNWRSEQEGYYYMVSTVEWWQSFCAHGYRIRNKRRHMMIKPSSLSTMEAEVIGNIFENPELISE